MGPTSTFFFPIRELSSDRVTLTPFLADRHADAFLAAAAGHPELFAHMPSGPFETREEFVSAWVEGRVAADPRSITLFAILARTASGDGNGTDASAAAEPALAGAVGYMNTSPANLCTEIAFIVVLPAHHRRGLATHAAGLLTRYALDPPAAGGLGLRRVAWQTSTMNGASAAVAEKLGFRREAVVRWDRRFRRGRLRGKVGHGRPLPPGPDEDADDLWRDTLLLALCWDDWAAGGAEAVARLLGGEA